MEEIDFTFIERLEGGTVLYGYVPKDERGGIESGVTVGSGFDIGQRSRIELVSTLPKTLAAKLAPYALLRGEEAKKYLAKKPLTITQEEAQDLTRITLTRMLSTVSTQYNLTRADNCPYWNELPTPIKTVIASLAWNFGPALSRVIPRTWGYIIHNNWKDLIALLLDFPHRQVALRNRRYAEAQYLRVALPESKTTITSTTV